MNRLKDEIIKSPALCHLDYKSSQEVILAVDTSIIAVGFILSQEGEDGKHYPSWFGSISLTSVKSQYSQAKLKLYRLFCSLRAVRVFIFRATNLVVEMDAKYVKGMINNPDLTPNATINQWIAGILLFHFTLRHIPADRHTGPNGLSHQPPSEDDPPDQDDFEDWLDDSYSFCITLLNDQTSPPAAGPAAIHTCPNTPYFPSLVSSPPDTPLLLPYLSLSLSLSYISIFASSPKLVPQPASPPIPWSVKAIARAAQIRTICGFLDTRERPADLSEADFQLFVKLATKFFPPHGSLWW